MFPSINKCHVSSYSTCVTTIHWDIAKSVQEGAVSSLTFPMLLADCHLDLHKPVVVNLNWRIEIPSFPNGEIITSSSLSLTLEQVQSYLVN